MEDSAKKVEPTVGRLVGMTGAQMQAVVSNVLRIETIDAEVCRNLTDKLIEAAGDGKGGFPLDGDLFRDLLLCCSQVLWLKAEIEETFERNAKILTAQRAAEGEGGLN